MRWILLLGALLAAGCGAAHGAPKERELLASYPGARSLQRASADDGYGVVFTHKQGSTPYVGVALVRRTAGAAYQTHAQSRVVERMPGLDTPVVVQTDGEAGALLFIAGLASHPAAARVEVRINGGRAHTAQVKEGGYALFAPVVPVHRIDVQLYDRVGQLIDRWPLLGVPAAWRAEGGDA